MHRLCPGAKVYAGDRLDIQLTVFLGGFNHRSVCRGLSSYCSDRTPDPLGNGWHVDVIDAEGGERVDDCIDNGLRRGDAPGLARALDAERIGGSRQLGEGDVE